MTRLEPGDLAPAFTLLDRVVAIEPGKSVTAVKAVSLSEEYLADHFPRFPVLPGVMMTVLAVVGVALKPSAMTCPALA
mgnify:CR=1 FL=1